MLRINIHEAKTHLSKYVRRIKKGETILLCERNLPFAEIRPLSPAVSSGQRPFGLYAGQIRIREDFNELDVQLEQDFEESKLFPNQ